MHMLILFCGDNESSFFYLLACLHDQNLLEAPHHHVINYI